MITQIDGLTPAQTQAVLEDPKFVRYIERITSNFTVGMVHVTGVDWFGKRPGFIHVTSELTDANGDKIPGCATLRGDGVGIVVLLNTPVQSYTVLVEQPRGPVGETIFEIPAGTLDKSQDPLVIAIAEIQEEVSPLLVATADQLELLYEGYASPGGSDELISIVLAQFDVTEQFVIDLNGSLTGAASEDEHIRVFVMNLVEAMHKCRDLKSMLGLQMAMDRIPCRLPVDDAVTLHNV